MEYSRWPGDIDVMVKRLDKIHPVVSGNKLFKLKYNIENALSKGLSKVVTFGGVWSNHLHAAAYALKESGLQMIAIVRGEALGQESKMIQDIRALGAEVHYVSRVFYAEKDTEEFKMWLIEQFGEVYIIPEGGANYLGVNGCMEILEPEDRAYTDVFCCAGTGTMASGLALTLSAGQRLHVISALKGGGMQDEITRKLEYFFMDKEAAIEQMERVLVYENFHRGGYAKYDQELVAFIERSEVPLDFVYTAKMMMALESLIKEGRFNEHSKILAIHSGGLQGNRGLSSFQP